MADDELTEPEMAGLPDDPTLAFIAYEKRLRPETRDKTWEYVDAQQQYEPNTNLARRYVNSLIAFVEVEVLPPLIEKDPPLDSETFWEWYYAFLLNVDRRLVGYQLAHARGRSANVVTAIRLSPNYKEQIGRLLERIRKIVNQAELGDDKKDTIYKKITALQAEVDRSKTSLAGFLSAWLDVTNAIGEGGENMERGVPLLERLMRLFGQAKADHDRGQLPAPEEKKQLPPPEPETDDLDDEIPF